MLSPFFRDTAAGFFSIESTLTTMVCADFGTSGKEVAASWLTVPEKMMLDFLVSAALSAACGAAAFAQPDSASHRASQRPAPLKPNLRNNVEIFMRSEERRVGKECRCMWS